MPMFRYANHILAVTVMLLSVAGVLYLGLAPDRLFALIRNLGAALV